MNHDAMQNLELCVSVPHAEIGAAGHHGEHQIWQVREDPCVQPEEVQGVRGADRRSPD